MIYQSHNFYIITGGPGVGKTTVLDQLIVYSLIVRSISRYCINDIVKVPHKIHYLFIEVIYEKINSTF